MKLAPWKPSASELYPLTRTPGPPGPEWSPISTGNSWAPIGSCGGLIGWVSAGTNETSQAVFGKAFVALTPQQQDTVLQSLDKGQARGEYWKQISAKSFFHHVVEHAMQGFYGDPRHGGNRERVSWKMLRLPYPPVLGRQHEDLTKKS